MPLFTHASPYLETLVSLLGAHLATDLAATGTTTANAPNPAPPPLFRAPWILTPNAHIQRWLELRLAREHGITIGLHFEYPESGAWELLAAMDSGAPPKRLPREVLQWMIFFLLRSGTLGDADAPARAYLGTTSPDDPHATRKCWQLADALSRHLREYAFRDPERIARWEAGGTESEPWAALQATLYRLLFGAGGIRDRLAEATGQRYQSLPEYEASSDPKRILPANVPAIHLFATRNLNPWLVRFYQGWAMHNPVHLYLPDCGEAVQETGDETFWTGQMRTWRIPAVDARSLWKQAAPVASAQHPLKTHLQGMQAFLRGEGVSRVPEGDGSVLLLDAPGVRREVEGVYEDILTRLRDDPDTRLTDIGILVSDMTRYSPVIQSVFDRTDGRDGVTDFPLIPINLVDTSAGEESLYAEAVRGLFDLLDGEGTREAVLGWLRNPAVMAAKALTEADLDAWEMWAEGLNLFAGLEAAAPRGWGVGVRRLAWGRLMAADANPVRARVFDGVVPYAEGVGQDAVSMNRFVACILRLMGLREAVRAPGLSWTQALALVQEALTEWVGVPPDAPGEASVAQALQMGLNQARRCMPVFAEGERPTLAALRCLVEDSLAPLPLRRGARFCGGVTVAALKPESVVPFAHVYILGLGEGEFPGRAAHRPLDLLEAEPGARDAPTYRCQAFLDALLSARKSLRLSWVGRDLQTDEVFEPCGLLATLRHAMAEAGLPPVPCRAVPFHAASRSYLDPESPFAAQARRVPDRLQGLAALAESVPLPPESEHALRDARRDTVFSLPPNPEADPHTRTQHDTRTLARFLELPAEATLSRRLHIRTRGGRVANPVESDPLSMEAGVRGRVMQVVLEAILLAHEAEPFRAPEAIAAYLLDLWQPTRASLAGQGALPEGVFGEVALREVEETLQATVAGDFGAFLLEHAPPDHVPCGGIVFGNHVVSPRVREWHAPLALAGGMEVHAGLPWMWESEAGTTVLVLCPYSAPPLGKAPDAHWLEPYLSLLAYQCAGQVCKPASIHQLYKTGDMRCHEIPPDPEAGAWLETLVEAAGTEACLVGVPYAELRKPRSKMRQAVAVEDVKAWLLDEMDNTFTVLRWPDALRIAAWEVPGNLPELVEARWGRILAQESS